MLKTGFRLPLIMREEEKYGLMVNFILYPLPMVELRVSLTKYMLFGENPIFKKS